MRSDDDPDSVESFLNRYLLTDKGFVPHADNDLDSPDAAGTVKLHRHSVRAYFTRPGRDGLFGRLGDPSREALENWLASKRKAGRSARFLNAQRAAIIAFGNWCIRTGRLTASPFLGIRKANEAADPRRKRRAMTDEELSRLIDMAVRRPLLDAQMVGRGRRKAEAFAKLKDANREFACGTPDRGTYRQ